MPEAPPALTKAATTQRPSLKRTTKIVEHHQDDTPISTDSDAASKSKGTQDLPETEQCATVQPARKEVQRSAPLDIPQCRWLERDGSPGIEERLQGVGLNEARESVHCILSDHLWPSKAQDETPEESEEKSEDA